VLQVVGLIDAVVRVGLHAKAITHREPNYMEQIAQLHSLRDRWARERRGGIRSPRHRFVYGNSMAN
jgi:hypothetical protein